MRRTSSRFLKPILAIAASVALLMSRPAGRDLNATGQSQQTPVEREYQEDVRRLEAARSSRNVDQVEQLVQRASAKWKLKDRQAFLNYMYQACGQLSSYTFADQLKRATLLSRLAISVLRDGNLSIEEETRFVEFLALDPVTIEPESWRRLRAEKATFWLASWKRVVTSIIPGFDFDDLPFLNVAPPAAARMPAGVSPDAIQDLRLRAEYERTIAANSAKAVRYNEQIRLKQNASAFLERAERYLTSAYSKPPKNQPELERLLSEYSIDVTARRRILDAVKSR